jgi:predicted aminopeptidase
VALFSSCAKIAYVSKQAIGQLSLELSGVDNKEILKSDKLNEKEKQKIKDIIAYKEYFYKYFNKEKTSIYDETTILKDEAVTYLVISSKFDEVKPKQHSFFFAGTFPYLGFFDLYDAKVYANKLKEYNNYVFIRPVYAYSTLDKLPFKDNILSSFFRYNKTSLAELIFHELVHTIFFVTDEVSFNESLADYIATEMMYEYFNFSKGKILEQANRHKKNRELSYLLTSLANKYKKLIDKIKPTSKEQADKILESYLDIHFKPKISLKCNQLKMKKCWPLKRVWNNASFSAFLTYQKEQKSIEKIRGSRTIKEFMSFLESQYDLFHRSSAKSFVKFLNERNI